MKYKTYLYEPIIGRDEKYWDFAEDTWIIKRNSIPIALNCEGNIEIWEFRVNFNYIEFI